MLTLGAALAAAAKSPAGVRFVPQRGEPQLWSYASLWAGAGRVAAGLAACGVRPRDVVALVLPTGPAFYEAFFGALWLGAVPVALYPPVRLGQLEAYHQQTARSLTVCGAKLLLSDQRIRRILGQAVAAARPPLGCQAIEELVGGAASTPSGRRAAPPPVHEAGADEVAFLQLSSGTTAAPKAVALTHRQVVANMRAIAERIYRDAPLPTGVAQHTAVSWLPLYHDMGLVGCLLTALYEQTTLTLIAPELFVARPAVWLETISRYRATVSAAPNFAYSLCVKRVRPEDLVGLDLSCWQVALNGAETVVAATIDAFCRTFAPCGFRPAAMTPVYGLAEAALGVTFSSAARPPTVTSFDGAALEREGRAVPAVDGQPHVSVGSPLAGYEVRIVDEAGTPLAGGRRGHVQVAGPSIVPAAAGPQALLEPRAGAAGAATQPSPPLPSPAGLGAGAFLATGDLGFVYDGELYIVGRHKDVVIVRGRNVAPHLIEQSLHAVAGVRTGCAVAASHRPAGQDTEALVVLAERSGPRGTHEADREADGEATLRARIERAVMSACQLKPDTIVLLAPGTLPRTSSGKLRRRAALSAYLAGTLCAPQPTSWWRMTLELLRSRRAMARARRARAAQAPGERA